MKRKILITGSSGLTGSEVCRYLADQNYTIHGIDNNQRAIFFGEQGDTRWNQKRLEETLPDFSHHELDIRNRQAVIDLLKQLKPHVIVHAAAQPSHDRAPAIPFDDFDTNAVGTLNLLEAARQACPESPFIHMSTNKVYVDATNKIKLRELKTRWDYDDPAYEHGISKAFTIDQSTHSLFGASKVAADIMVQEYGRYFDMPTCCLRGGCLTGPNHYGVELHGFLSFLVKCNLEERDNIHSLDVARFMLEFTQAPRCGEVYNLGGGKDNSCSILEAFNITETFSNKEQKFAYLDENRIGDHICYYSDLRKMREHYPRWNISITLNETIRQIVEDWQARIESPLKV